MVAKGGISQSETPAQWQRCLNSPHECFTMNSPSTLLSHRTHEEIARRAREIWYARNCPTDRDEEIWFEAERQLSAEQPISSTAVDRAKEGGVDIDDRALAERLNDFGNPGSRSPTSVDPTTLT